MILEKSTQLYYNIGQTIAFEYASDSILNAYFHHFKSVISPIWCPKSAMRLHSKGVL